MKSVLGLGLVVIIISFFHRPDGRLTSPGAVTSFTSELVESPQITTGKHGKIILSLSFERSRFKLDGDAESVLYSNGSSVDKLNNLKKGGQVTVWYLADEEQRTHSFLNFVDALGLAIGGEVVVEPKQTEAKGERQAWWMLIIGIALSVIGLIGLVVGKSRL